MRDTLRLLTLVILLTGFGFWLGLPRIVVLAPLGEQKEGSTAIVLGASGINLIDSPEAICERAGTSSYYCHCTVAERLFRQSIIRLPFSQMLHDFSGAPDLTSEN